MVDESLIHRTYRRLLGKSAKIAKKFIFSGCVHGSNKRGRGICMVWSSECEDSRNKEASCSQNWKRQPVSH
ncbi:hypothetical protein A2U01_0042844 [Trifolium medium]|uniref:Uncharacterized protein n=1 Tax=Trifolium medium TaxID=97028 RepID=A0A392QEH6_9FABA|nr:hypothetical protein [Trifolium medium]